MGVIFSQKNYQLQQWAHTGTASRKQIHKSAWPRVWSLPNPVRPQNSKERFWQGVGQVSPLSVLYVEAGLTPSEQISPWTRERYTDKAVLEASGTRLIHSSSAMLKWVPGSTNLSSFISQQSHKADTTGLHCLSKPRSRLFPSSSFRW